MRNIQLSDQDHLSLFYHSANWMVKKLVTFCSFSVTKTILKCGAVKAKLVNNVMS